MTPVTAVANGTASVVAAQAAAPQVRASLSPSRPQNFCLSLSLLMLMLQRLHPCQPLNLFL